MTVPREPNVPRFGRQRCPNQPAKPDRIVWVHERHYTEPEPIKCKWCGSKDIMKYGTRKDVQEYVCQNCGRKFVAVDAPYRKQTPSEQIGAALTMFYDGLSFADIARHLEQHYNNPVNASTVYRWVMSYTEDAVTITTPYKATVSQVWIVDETVLDVAGKHWWFWDVIDEKTRFLLASHLSPSRTIPDVVTVMRRAQAKAGKPPKWVLSDNLNVYPDGIERAFGADSYHIQTKGLTSEINTNLIERFHGTLKDRTKVIRGFKGIETAAVILDGFLVHYNYFRPHMSLKDKTPAQVAGITIPYKTWTELIRQAGGLHLDA